MKNLFIVTSLFLAASLANAASKKVMFSELVPQNLAKEHFQSGVVSGSVALDLEGKTITLTVQPNYYCPVGMICPAVMPQPIEIELPLISKKKNACDVVIYTAFRDNRPVDGIYEAVIVKDNRNFGKKCKSIAPVPFTSVSYNTKGYNWTGTNEVQFDRLSEFSGNKLKTLKIQE